MRQFRFPDEDLEEWSGIQTGEQSLFSMEAGVGWKVFPVTSTRMVVLVGKEMSREDVLYVLVKYGPYIPAFLINSPELPVEMGDFIREVVPFGEVYNFHNRDSKTIERLKEVFLWELRTFIKIGKRIRTSALGSLRDSSIGAPLWTRG